MQEKNFIKLLVSIPVILLALYFIPFLGAILLIFRLFMVESKKRRIALLIIIGVLLLLPQGINELLKAILSINVSSNSLFELLYLFFIFLEINSYF